MNVPSPSPHAPSPILLACAVMLAAIAAAGCGPLARRAAVPVDLTEQAVVAGMPADIRYYSRHSEDIAHFIRDWIDSIRIERRHLANNGYSGGLPPADYIAISGGGDGGAFGAGFLTGWSEAGTRPTFKIVTGISTGALMAPFAFLGPRYDDRLKQLYTEVSGSDIAHERNLFTAVFQDALADNTPLRNLVKRSFTQEIMDAIAAEHEKGRMLLIGTTNLDARRAVIWNVTKIAASRRPEALKLVRELLLASSAIPGTFPPVMIDVEVGGKKYQEMHVDGGAAVQAFAYPAAILLGEEARKYHVERKRTLYILRNARVDPQWAEVERQTLPIAFKAIATLIQFQGIGDLFRMYAITQRDGVGYKLAYIPPTFDVPKPKPFDTNYMRELFKCGQALAKNGYEWQTHPPVIVVRPTSEMGSAGVSSPEAGEKELG